MNNHYHIDITSNSHTHIDISGDKGGKKGGSKPRKPVNFPDNLYSDTTAYLLEGISEGPIKGMVDQDNIQKSVYFEDTPIYNADGSQNIFGVNSYFRHGTPSQDPIPGFERIFNNDNIGNAQVVTFSSPVSKAAVDDSQYTGLGVEISIPSLYKINTSNGDVVNNHIEFRVTITNDTDPSTTPQSIGHTMTIAGKSTSPYNLTLSFNIRPSFHVGDQWLVKVERISLDYNESTRFGQLFTTGWSFHTDSYMGYHNTALIAHQISGREYGDSIVPRTYDVDGLIVQIPRNYDNDPDSPTFRQYEGIWDGTWSEGWTDNPAWIVRDILVNERYGLGYFLDADLVDKWSLYEIAQYNDAVVAGEIGTPDEGNMVFTDYNGVVVGGVDDGAGGKEPRHTCNIIISDRRAAYEVVNQLTSVFWGMSYWSTGTVMFTQDRPRDIDLVVSRANVINGSFNYEGTSLKDRHSTVNVNYINKNQDYKPAIVSVQDDSLVQKLGIQPLDTVAIGCTSEGQAVRWGRYLLDNERYANQVITYKAGWDHAFIRPGDIIGVNDPVVNNDNRLGGRIVTPGTTSLTIDQSVDFETGNTYNILVALPEGDINPNLLTITGISQNTTARVTITNHGLKIGQKIKITDVEGMTEINGQELFVGVVFDDDNIDVYENETTPLDSSGYSAYTAGGYLYPDVDMPRTLQLKIETVEIDNPGVSTDTFNLVTPLSQSPLSGAMFGITIEEEVVLRQFRVTSITPDRDGEYTVSGLLHDPNKYARIEEGIELEPEPTANFPTNKFLDPPSDITYLEALYLAGPTARSKAVFSWTASPDTRTTYYEIQYQDPNDDIPDGTWSPLPPTGDLSTELLDTQFGTYKIRIRARDNSWHVSDWVTREDIELSLLSQPPANVQNFQGTIKGESLELTWDRVPDLDLSRYELRFSPVKTAAWSTSQTIHSAISKDTDTITITGKDGSYHIKAYDQLGNSSINAKTVIVSMNSIFDFNVVETLTEDPGFAGTKVDTEVSGGNLYLALGDFMSDWASLDIVLTLAGGVSNYSPTGEYYLETRHESGTMTDDESCVDLGDVYESRVFYDIVQTIIVVGATLDTWGILDTVGRLDGGGDGDELEVEVQVATTEDDPVNTITAPTWSSWETLTLNNYRARAFKFRLLMSTNDPIKSPCVEEFSITVDMPDREITNPAPLLTVNSAPGYTVDFTNTGDNISGEPFKGPAKPSIGITLHDAAAGDYYTLTQSSISETGFEMTIRDSGGTPKAAYFDYVAKGYGALKS